MTFFISLGLSNVCLSERRCISCNGRELDIGEREDREVSAGV
jgi:hypothetical protein